MSGLTTEQHVATQKAGVDTSFAILNKALEGIDRLTELNVQAVKSILAENQEFFIKVLSAENPQETFSQQSILAQPVAERVQSYWHHVYEILSSTRAEFSALAETQYKQLQTDTRSFIDGLTKNAPPESEAAVTAWTTFFTTAGDTARSVYETAAKATTQAVETAESNLNTASTAKRTRQTLEPVEPTEKE